MAGPALCLLSVLRARSATSFPCSILDQGSSNISTLSKEAIWDWNLIHFEGTWRYPWFLRVVSCVPMKALRFSNCCQSQKNHDEMEIGVNAKFRFSNNIAENLSLRWYFLYSLSPVANFKHKNKVIYFTAGRQSHCIGNWKLGRATLGIYTHLATTITHSAGSNYYWQTFPAWRLLVCIN